MTYPVQDTNHVAEGKALLIEQFKKATNVNALIGTYLRPVQDLETVFWALINGFMIGAAVGDQLDALGALVGEARLGRNDTNYRAAVLLRVRVNRSQGLAEDIIQVANLASGNTAKYFEYYPLGFEVQIDMYSTPNILARMLYSTKAVSVLGALVTTQSTNAVGFNDTNITISGWVFDTVAGTTHVLYDARPLSPAGVTG